MRGMSINSKDAIKIRKHRCKKCGNTASVILNANYICKECRGIKRTDDTN